MNSQKTEQILRGDPYVFDFHHNYVEYMKQKMLRLYDKKKNNNNTSSPTSVINPLQDSFSKHNRFRVNEYLQYHVYVPKLYPQYCSKRILCAEWCDGTKMNNEKDRPSNISTSELMQTVVSLFGWQIFVTGLVHCDPHPGNVLVREHPSLSSRNAQQRSQTYASKRWYDKWLWFLWSADHFKGNHQIVFLDHGLYIEESEKFRKQYARLWTAMFLNDHKTLHAICQDWGIEDTDFFASAQLMKPFVSQAGPYVLFF
ncbi:ABC transporter [Reticulomyxa filosa]|uniref:ABC transporter n=1 Tax=Reticulomyxa filosa TaxID=46433 RepID=X6PES5_RETFI|nr:ABC transporter [Reticulomyxa filosa]|eukprot:ETO36990.1 ABC transporter [Reticulomyxa filosa]